MPLAQRQQPLWQQIVTYFRQRIASGELPQGAVLPSVRAIAAEWGVSPHVAQQAVSHLHLAERLVRTDATGTYVDAPRATVSPQQRMRLTADPASLRVSVTSAGLVDAPAYVVPMLGLPEHGATVIRREEVTRLADGTAHMLSVTWVSPRYFTLVPELTREEPLPDPRGAAYMVAERLGIDPGTLTGGIAFECRPAKDDSRERPALDLGDAEPAYVLAGVNGWRHGDDLLAYTEFILPPGQVVEADIEP